MGTEKSRENSFASITKLTPVSGLPRAGTFMTIIARYKTAPEFTGFAQSTRRSYLAYIKLVEDDLPLGALADRRQNSYRRRRHRLPGAAGPQGRNGVNWTPTEAALLPLGRWTFHLSVGIDTPNNYLAAPGNTLRFLNSIRIVPTGHGYGGEDNAARSHAMNVIIWHSLPPSTNDEQ
jgi:hypothetical protein